MVIMVMMIKYVAYKIFRMIDIIRSMNSLPKVINLLEREVFCIELQYVHTMKDMKEVISKGQQKSIFYILVIRYSVLYTFEYVFTWQNCSSLHRHINSTWPIFSSSFKFVFFCFAVRGLSCRYDWVIMHNLPLINNITAIRFAFTHYLIWLTKITLWHWPLHF